MIKMKYPNIKGDNINDGKIHTITPFNILKIEDLDLYIMVYFDETKYDERVTILDKINDKEILNIPVLNYKKIFDIILNEKMNLLQVDTYDFLSNYTPDNKDENYIKSTEMVKSLYDCLEQARTPIILYIDSKKDIFYYKDNKIYKNVPGNMLIKIMQLYDIEWRNISKDKITSKKDITEAIDNALGLMLVTSNHDNNLSVNERYEINDKHHYTVTYQNKTQNISKAF